jgi:HSP20 family protein
MTTTITESNYTQSAWKVSTVFLAVMVAALGLAVGLESCLLYRADHPVAAIVRQDGSRPQHNSRPADPAILAIEDWPAPVAPAVNASPWDRLNALHQQMDQIFNNTLSQFSADDPALVAALSRPNLDVREEKDHYTVRADMPGADKPTLKVRVEGRLLTISGARTTVNETKTDDKVVRSERSMAQFVRTIELPGPVKAESVTAKYDNGVLTLTLPKADQAASSAQIPVH